MTKFWGSRFDKETDNLADKFSFSISYDYKLAKYDCIGGISHAQMLGNSKIISKTDATKLISGLKKLLEQIENGKFQFDNLAEDIHTNIQMELKKLIGDTADKLHTARSRNDLIVLDMKMYCIDELTNILILIEQLQKSIVKFADNHKDVIIPAYTHLQSAQVVLLAHHMLAYVEMLERDKERIFHALMRMDEMPLGSCALSGSSFPTKRDEVAKSLGFSAITQNSIDSVSDRDFIVETLSSLAIMGMHFSRIAEDLILWATSEFSFVVIDSSLCTGSSIMPHKKNPDILELIRGETANLYSNLNSLLVLLKGLPLSYNRDLQLDKPPLFASVEKSKDMLGLFEKLFATLKVRRDILEIRAKDEYFFTVDVMEYLIKKGVSYRDAHDIVGNIVKNCLDKGRKISTLTLHQLQEYSTKFDLDVKDLLHPEASIKNKKSLGSTNPQMVLAQINFWKKELK